MAGRALNRAPERTLLAGPDGPVGVTVWPGDSDRRAAVLLAFHGWTDDSGVFAPLAEALDPRHPVVAVDAPGHGRSPLPDGDYVVPGHAGPAAAVLAALPQLAGPAGRSRPVVAYGHSMGALTAARLAAGHRREVTALVLEDPARTTLRRPAAVAGMRTWIAGLRTGAHEDRVAWARANHPDWPAAEFGPWAEAKATVDLAEFDRRHDWGEPLPVVLAEVFCPTLLVRGDPGRGGIVSARAAARCQATCPGGLEVLALDAGHSPRREAPEDFADALGRVLAAA